MTSSRESVVADSSRRLFDGSWVVSPDQAIKEESEIEVKGLKVKVVSQTALTYSRSGPLVIPFKRRVSSARI